MSQDDVDKRDGGAAQDAGSKARKPRQVLLDEIKEAHTTHWDMDVMPREQLEAMHARNRRQRRRRKLMMVAGVGGGSLLATVCAVWLAVRLLA